MSAKGSLRCCDNGAWARWARRKPVFPNAVTYGGPKTAIGTPARSDGATEETAPWDRSALHRPPTLGFGKAQSTKPALEGRFAAYAVAGEAPLPGIIRAMPLNDAMGRLAAAGSN